MTFKNAVPYELTFLASFCDDRIVDPDDYSRKLLFKHILKNPEDMGYECLRQLILSNAKDANSASLIEGALENEDSELPLVDSNNKVSYSKFSEAVRYLNDHPPDASRPVWIKTSPGKGGLDGRIYLNPIKDGDDSNTREAKKDESTDLYYKATASSKEISDKVIKNSDIMGFENVKELGTTLEFIATTRGKSLFENYKKIYNRMTTDPPTVTPKEGSEQLSKDRLMSWIEALTGKNDLTGHVSYNNLADAVKNNKVSYARFERNNGKFEYEIEKPTTTTLGHLTPIKNIVEGHSELSKYIGSCLKK